MLNQTQTYEEHLTEMALWNCVRVCACVRECVCHFFCLTTHSVAPTAAESVQQSLRLLNLPAERRPPVTDSSTCTALTQIIPNLLFRSSQRQTPSAARGVGGEGSRTRGETMPSGRANCDAATPTTWECQRAICSANRTLCTSTPFQFSFFFFFFEGHRASV